MSTSISAVRDANSVIPMYGDNKDIRILILRFKSEHFSWTRQQDGGYRQTERRSERGGGGRQMQVNGRGYTHSIVAGVALRQPSCQFSIGTGMQVSLMVS